jgi:FixJ family two-component response regulator
MTTRVRFLIGVVDDDARTLESVAELLAAAGFDSRLHGSGSDLWARGGVAELDCLISDIGMPEMDGFELRRLALAARPDLPVILITGRPEVSFVHRQEMEAGLYFEKPFDARRLLAAITHALVDRRPRRKNV